MSHNTIKAQLDLPRGRLDKVQQLPPSSTAGDDTYLNSALHHHRGAHGERGAPPPRTRAEGPPHRVLRRPNV